jgi:hypothetical protein
VPTILAVQVTYMLGTSCPGEVHAVTSCAGAVSAGNQLSKRSACWELAVQERCLLGTSGAGLELAVQKVHTGDRSADVRRPHEMTPVWIMPLVELEQLVSADLFPGNPEKTCPSLRICHSMIG